MKLLKIYEKKWSKFIFSINLDLYYHYMEIHNGEDLNPLNRTNFKLAGAFLQTTEKDFSKVNRFTKQVIDRSAKAGKVWPVDCDEPGDPIHALIPDDEDPEHYNAGTNGLWRNLLAGGWGTEWCFGCQHPHADLSCQEYRSRELFWDMGAKSICFFEDNQYSVEEMDSHNELLSSENDFCLAKEGDLYIVLFKEGNGQIDFKNFDEKYSKNGLIQETGRPF